MNLDDRTKTTVPPRPGTPEWAEYVGLRIKKYGLRAVRVWGYIGIGIIAVAVAWALGQFGTAVTTLLLSAVLAFVYAPIVNFLERRFRVPRLLGTFIGLVALIAAATLLAVILVPPLTEQCVSLAKAYPRYAATLSQTWDSVVSFFDRLDPSVQSAMEGTFSELGKALETAAGNIASAVGNGLLKGVTGTVSGIVALFMALVISFWLAKDFPRMEREMSTIVGPRIAEDYLIVTSVFGRSLGGYLRGLVITSTCTGCIAGVGFWILGIPYSGLLGLITALLNIIPFIGPWMGGILAFLVAVTVGWVPAFLSIVVTVCAQQFTDTFVSPKVMQAAVALHPALVIVAMLAGGSLGGIVGMIAVVPLTAALKGVFVYYFEKRTGRQLVSPDGAIFKGTRFNDADGAPRAACDALGVDIEGDEGVPPRIKAEMMRERGEAAGGAGRPAGEDAGAGSGDGSSRPD